MITDVFCSCGSCRLKATDLPSGEKATPSYFPTEAAAICVLLEVGMWRIHSVCSPLLSATCTTYLPSGEIAARLALPESVSRVMVKLRNGACVERVASE